MRKRNNKKTQVESSPSTTDSSRKAKDSRNDSNSLNGGTADPRIRLWVQQLSSPRAAERERARSYLVAIGDEVVPELIEVVATADDRGRLEAAAALTEIADPAAIPTLIECLEDDHQDVRWVAAEGLLNIDGPAVEPLLLALIDRAWAHTILEGALHVVRGLARRVSEPIFGPLLSALTHAPEPGVNVPPAAVAALAAWRKDWKPTPRTRRTRGVTDQPSDRPKPWYDRRR
jgi:HEAT repeats